MNVVSSPLVSRKIIAKSVFRGGAELSFKHDLIAAARINGYSMRRSHDYAVGRISDLNTICVFLGLSICCSDGASERMAVRHAIA